MKFQVHRHIKLQVNAELRKASPFFILPCYFKGEWDRIKKKMGSKWTNNYHRFYCDIEFDWLCFTFTISYAV